MEKIKNDVIVTGIPRGGTTLTTALFDHLENAICLSEPPWQSIWFKNKKNAQKVTELIVNDYKKIRKNILDHIPVKDFRNKNGSPITNYFNEEINEGARKNVRKKGEFVFKVKDENFLLGMKHNAHYTSILPQLIETDAFSIIAIVRHPIPTILSWKSLNIPVSQGRLPYGETFWKELRDITCSKDKSLLTLVKIYDLFCQRYLTLNHDIHLLKYEEIIRNPLLLEELTGRTYEKKIELTNQNQNKLYNISLADEIKELITLHAPHALKLYSMNDEAILGGK
ncbi:sulfotransferase domain-containing protein [Neobacillus ginsengisoli]|uniref:Sulfotransferase domain-containing protein n=1 Tax=Neobacillus ginsengisoli TaxID=904295 RepID=A0ABT9Y108_9BACI|nr:sulfotransferase domain-containing protein [Neobacillus ginsengisoli]MDQ0200819.1 hypothetical protein [Neobacillus ginsengisoli]